MTTVREELAKSVTQAQMSSFFIDKMKIINVLSYGAKGDGVTDDTTAIQAAIDAAFAAGGGIVFLPEGTCIASQILLKGNVVLVGAGKNITILKQKDNSNVNFVSAANTSITFYGIKNLTIDGNYANQTTGNGLVLAGNDSFAIGCEVKNCKSYGILLFGGARSKVEGCYVHHNKNVGIFVGNDGFTIDDVNISNSQIEYNESHGILVGNNATTIATNVTVSDNIVNLNGTDAGPGGGGIWAVVGAADVTISNNNVKANHGDNIGIAGAVRVTITGNISKGATGPITDLVNSGIAISTGSVNITVTGNVCYNNSGMGIGVRGTSTNITIIGNLCYNNSSLSAGDWAGIQLLAIAPDTGSGNYITIIGNRCYDDRAVANRTQSYGIVIDTNANNVICKDNLVTNNKLGTLLNNGVASQSVIIQDNQGYNPVGNLTPPALSSGVGIANSFAFPVQIFISGGTVSAIYIGATLTGLTSGMFILQPNIAIQINYSAAPSWVWIGL